MSFWAKLPSPIIGLSPMDGVTDAAFRAVVDRVSHPHVLYTEFVPVEAIKAQATKVLEAFISHVTSTPVVAQIYGTDLEGYQLATWVVCAMGFDGIDINMGCPAKSVAARGAGAGLIRQPSLAIDIIKTVQNAVKTWHDGMTLADIPLKTEMRDYIIAHTVKSPKDHLTPVSVKTRIGYEVPQTQEWISTLAQMNLAALTVHGRTLKQLYTGKADWNEIALAAKITRTISPTTKVLGSGDVSTYQQALERVHTYQVDGALIGRATWGDPWIFSGRQVTLSERLDIALEHARVFTTLLPHGHFLALRKHMGWYMQGFPGSTQLRVQMLRVSSLSEIETIVTKAKQLLNEMK